MMKNCFYVGLTLLVSVSCTPFSALESVTDEEQRVLVSNSSLCTTLADYEAKPFGSGANISIRCLDSSGEWVSASYPNDPSPGIHYGEPSLALASNGDVLALYHLGSTKHGTQIAVSRTGDSGWSPLGPLVNSDNGNFVGAYSQFGASITDFQGMPHVFWTATNGDAYLSRFDGSKWKQFQIKSEAQKQVIRHPEIFNSETDLYLYFGSPVPTVWRFNGTQLEKLGAMTTDPSETTLYSSFVVWQGKPVIAYSSDNSPNNWALNKSKIKTAVFENGKWTSMGEVQDLPGHDGVNPFLFTLGDELYVMYGDYSTDGLPTDANQVRLRFRVKKWNGLKFERVGDESPAVSLSQRFEFTLVNVTVYFTAVVSNANEIGSSSQIVLSWQDGVYRQVGQALVTKPESFWRARPGRVISTEGVDLSTLAKGKMLSAPKVTPGAESNTETIASLPRFIDSAGFNYRPQSASPMIDSGACFDGLLDSDADGVSRYSGFRCDIGAFEYGNN